MKITKRAASLLFSVLVFMATFAVYDTTNYEDFDRDYAFTLTTQTTHP
ncbi:MULTISPECIES: hypothetical protein [Paenibacillus]